MLHANYVLVHYLLRHGYRVWFEYHQYRCHRTSTQMCAWVEMLAKKK